ncbi:PIN domain-containing protein [Streptomyces mirabilis]|uniref:PIN domain-containing protein n=1 Tax=Streptomyces mirabilis TaxID=68239 RepID=UPI003826F30A
MIILDANILRGISLNSVSADLLKTIRAADVQGVAVPWTVLEELAAQRAIRHREKFEAARTALDALRKNTPWPIIAQVPGLDLERVRQHWRDVYTAVVDVLPASEYALREATFREANLLAPCKALTVRGTDKQIKTGARDASIWLTAVEYARKHEDETVYFVSANTHDFGDGSSYEYPMDRDVKEIRDRFVHYTSLDDVVREFTEPTEVDAEAVRAIITRPETTDLISQEVWNRWRVPLTEPSQPDRTPFRGTVLASDVTRDAAVAEGATAPAVGWFTHPDVVLDSLRDLSAYRIGDHVWCTATARWLLRGSAWVAAGGLSAQMLASAWNTRLLVSPTNSEAAATLLRSDPPGAVTEDELARLPESDQPWRHGLPLTAIPALNPKATTLENLTYALIAAAGVWSQRDKEG